MFVIKSQLWATAIVTLIPVAMLGVIHCELALPARQLSSCIELHVALEHVSR